MPPDPSSRPSSKGPTRWTGTVPVLVLPSTDPIARLTATVTAAACWNAESFSRSNSRSDKTSDRTFSLVQFDWRNSDRFAAGSSTARSNQPWTSWRIFREETKSEWLGLQLAAQPGLREPQVMTHYMDGHAQRFRRFFSGQAAKIPHFDQT